MKWKVPSFFLFIFISIFLISAFFLLCKKENQLEKNTSPIYNTLPTPPPPSTPVRPVQDAKKMKINSTDTFIGIAGLNTTEDFKGLFEELESAHITLRKFFEFHFLPSLGNLKNARLENTIRFRVGNEKPGTITWNQVHILDLKGSGGAKWKTFQLSGENATFYAADGTIDSSPSGWLKGVGEGHLSKENIPCDLTDKYCAWVGWMWEWKDEDQSYHHISGKCEGNRRKCTKWPIQFLDMRQI